MLSGGKPGPHKIQGIGAGFVPEVLNKKIIDEIIRADHENAGATAEDLRKKKAFLLGYQAARRSGLPWKWQSAKRLRVK